LEELQSEESILRRLRAEFLDPKELDPDSSAHMVGRRLTLARFLLTGPKKAVEIASHLGIHQGSLKDLIQHKWFEKLPGNKQAGYQLTAAGRKAIDLAG
jgi:hypothetical protein